MIHFIKASFGEADDFFAFVACNAAHQGDSASVKIEEVNCLECLTYITQREKLCTKAIN